MLANSHYLSWFLHITLYRTRLDDGDDFCYHIYFRCAAGVLPAQKKAAYRRARMSRSSDIMKTFGYMQAIHHNRMDSAWTPMKRPPYVSDTLQYQTLSLLLSAIAASGNAPMFMLLMRRLPRKLVNILQSSIMDSYELALQWIADSLTPAIPTADILWQQLNQIIPPPDMGGYLFLSFDLHCYPITNMDNIDLID
jgi:hypothetical protein